MKITVLIVSLLLVLSPVVCQAWELEFGKGKENVGYRAPVSDEDFPIGPSSFRLIDGDLWVLDAAAKRIAIFDSAGKLSNEILIPGLKKDYIIDDFAVMPGYKELVVVDGGNREIIKLSDKGKELARFKFSTEQLIQLDEVAIDSNGQLYVGDYGLARISVLSPAGKILRTIPWQISGFAVDKDDNLHMIDFTAATGHSLVKISAAGKELSRHDIGMKDVQNPRMWKVNAKGEIYFSVIPNEGNPTSQWLFKMSAKGEILDKKLFKNPYYVKRYLVFGKDEVKVVDANYADQSGKIKVLPVK